MKDYAYWKILAWRFIRVGIAGGISTAVALQLVLRPDFSNVKVYTVSLSSAFLGGFISSTALAIRDFISNGDKSDPIQKLPL